MHPKHLLVEIRCCLAPWKIAARSESEVSGIEYVLDVGACAFGVSDVIDGKC